MRQFSPRDIELLGYRDPIVAEDHPGWTRIKATLDAGLSVQNTEFVYLKAGCTTDQLNEANRTTSTTKPAYVLMAPSHRLTEQSVRATFANRAIDVFEIEAAVWRRLSSAFDKYLEALGTGVPHERYFVRPRKDQESRAELDKEVLDYLSGAGNVPPGTLMVVSAGAGVGKTTVARRAVLDVVRRMSQNKIIPIFVESTHWDKFNLEADLELWDIIRNSIDHFGGPIGLTQDLFNYGLQQGYFVFVFDGFDELCSPKQSQFSAIDVLRSFADLSKQTDARILLTTRALFWHNEIEKVGVPTNVAVLSLAPFNKQQALGYFQERFRRDIRKRDQAQTLYTNLVAASDLPENEEGTARSKFANLPLVVVMLAQYVEQGGVDFESQGLLIQDLLCRLCLRDQARQDLLANAQEQIRAFEEIAVNWDDSVNPEFDLATLELVGFPKEDLRDMRHHALVSPGRSANTYRFRWDFLAPYMRALFLRREIANRRNGLPGLAKKIMQTEANGKGFVFEHLCGLLDSSSLSMVAQCYSVTKQTETEIRSFLTHVILALLEADKQNYKTVADKTAAFISLLEQQSRS